MASSDNVLRAGPEVVNDTTKVYYAPVDDDATHPLPGAQPPGRR